MTRILVVDDSPIELEMASSLLEISLQAEVLRANDAAEALRILENEDVMLMLSDLQMPGKSGLELLAEVHELWPRLPVVIFTSQGSEDIAVAALRQGAAGYVAKRNMRKELVEVIERVLAATQHDRCQKRLMSHLVTGEFSFEFTPEPELIPALIQWLQEIAAETGICNERKRTQLGVALHEALVNADVHGNLEVSSELREHADGRFEELIFHRRGESPYAARTIRMMAKIDEETATFVIRDQGPGFDVASLPNPTDPENLFKASGRGILMMNAFMDSVEHNPQGNEVTMTLHRQAELVEASSHAATLVHS